MSAEESKPKTKKKLEDNVNYLKTWLARFGTAEQIVSDVQKKLEITEWKLKAVTECPDEAISGSDQQKCLIQKGSGPE